MAMAAARSRSIPGRASRANKRTKGSCRWPTPRVGVVEAGHVAHADPPALRFEREVVHAGKQLTFRLDDPHPEAPDLSPTFALTFRRVLEGRVTAVLASAPGEAWAASPRPRPWARAHGRPWRCA